MAAVEVMDGGAVRRWLELAAVAPTGRDGLLIGVE
jgi:hypothetical protein